LKINIKAILNKTFFALKKILNRTGIINIRNNSDRYLIRKPSSHLLKFLDELLDTKSKAIKIAEVGVGHGVTTLEIIKKMRPNDELDLFDRSDYVTIIKNRKICFNQRLPNDRAFNIPHDVLITFNSNTYKLNDSYAWSLLKILEGNLHSSNKKMWDIVYLDGSHRYDVDLAATACIKELLNVGGYFVLDDFNWSIRKSSTLNNPSFHKKYTKDQINSEHIKLIVNTILKTDKRFKEIQQLNSDRAVFMKISF
tara:strand:- start:519 stop:1277 length:759 start_codon:yes stop_codon:yes gene_type:complete